MEMALFPVLLVVIIHIANTNSGIISSSGLQRKYESHTCVFQWTVDETIVSYLVYNQTTGSQTPLSDSANYSAVNGVISLTINDIKSWDAGNYSLLVTTDKSTYFDDTACIFVYGKILGTVNLTPGTIPATEGDTVELTCSLASTSQPASYRMNIYYTWGFSREDQFRTISNGTVMLFTGDLFPRYTIKNNGRTLHINSVRYPDDETIYCFGLEDTINEKWYNFVYVIQIEYRPYISSSDPSSRKFTAIVGTTVAMSFVAQAIPPITSITNWTFVNSAGFAQDLPPNLLSYCSSFEPSFQFILTSAEFYGSYSITQSNALGSTTTTFEVLSQGPPDTPSSLELIYVSHCELYFQWNLMWSNTVTRLQTVFMRLRLSDTNAEVQTINRVYYEDYFGTYRHLLESNIQPLTNYIVSVWSVNSFGSSEVVEMKVRTRSQPKLSVSPQMISIKGTQAIINFSVQLGENTENISQIDAWCCSEFSGQCPYNFSEYTGNQIVVNNIPNGTVYYIDVTVRSGIYKYKYYSDSVKGVKVSRTRNLPSNNSDNMHSTPVLMECPENFPPSDNDDRHSLLFAVIVLTCLLGVAVVALMAILIVYLVKTSGQRRQPAKPPQLPSDDFLNLRRALVEEERPPPYVDDVCKPIDMDPSNDQHYYTGVNGSHGDKVNLLAISSMHLGNNYNKKLF